MFEAPRPISRFKSTLTRRNQFAHRWGVAGKTLRVLSRSNLNGNNAHDRYINCTDKLIISNERDRDYPRLQSPSWATTQPQRPYLHWDIKFVYVVPLTKLWYIIRACGSVINSARVGRCAITMRRKRLMDKVGVRRGMM